MKKEIEFLKIDYTIQKVLLILTVVAIPTFYFFVFPFVLLGFWQVASGIYGAARLRSKLHIYYIGLAIPYLFFMFYFMETFMNVFLLVFLILFYVIIPFFFAAGYFNLTKKTWNQLKEKRQCNEFEMEDVLDSDELFS